jgi:hypothetical protein
MKTQYFAKTSASPVTFGADDGKIYHGYSVVAWVKAKSMAELLELVKGIASINTEGDPIFQLIPITKEEYRAKISYKSFETLKPIEDYFDFV